VTGTDGAVSGIATTSGVGVLGQGNNGVGVRGISVFGSDPAIEGYAVGTGAAFSVGSSHGTGPVLDGANQGAIVNISDGTNSDDAATVGQLSSRIASGAMVTKSGNQTLSAGFQNITFDTEVRDIGGCHSGSDEEIYAMEEGWYTATFAFNMSGAQGVLPVLTFVLASGTDLTVRGDYRSQSYNTVTGMCYMEVGDYVYSYMFSDGAATVLAGVDNTSLTMARVG
jgi:hypothetical protein